MFDTQWSEKVTHVETWWEYTLNMKDGYERHQHEDNFGLSKQKDFKDAAVSYNYNHVIYKGNRSSH